MKKAVFTEDMKLIIKKRILLPFSIKQLSKELNITESALNHYLKKNKLEYKTYLTQTKERLKNKKEIIELYQSGKSLRFIAKKVNVSSGAIKDLLLNANVKLRSKNETRRFNVNEDFFNVIDTEEKAYFLGLLYADGCITNNYVSLTLQECDLHILESFKKSINYEGNISFRKLNDKRIEFENCKNCYSLKIGSIKLTKNLIKKGCFSRKTSTLLFPSEEQVPSHLLNHFIRGYFDGDGCLFVSKNDARISMISTDNFNIELMNVLIKELKLNKTKLVKDKRIKVNNISTIQYAGTQQVLKITNWLYKDSTIYLNRKFKKYQYLKEKC